MSDSTFVTIVKRKIVCEEKIITMEEFKKLKNLDLEEYSIFSESFEDMRLGDNVFDENGYIAFSGMC